MPELERDRPAISAPGDLWKLGKHLLLCGSALEQASYQRLMGDERAQMVFTDPPYNVAIDGHVCGLGSVRHQDFEMASGEMTEPEFTAFLNSFMGHAVQLQPGRGDPLHLHGLAPHGRGPGRRRRALRAARTLCVWNKTNGGMGTFYRSKHEMVFVFKVGSGPHINNFGLGEKGRYRTNVWDYAGVNTFKRGRMDELRAHPTVKPLPLVVDALKDCSTRGGLVLDPVRRQRHDPAGGGEDRPRRPRHRARPALRRRRHRPLAGTDRRGSGSCRDRQDVQRAGRGGASRR